MVNTGRKSITHHCVCPPYCSFVRSHAPLLPPALPHWVFAKAALAQMRPKGTNETFPVSKQYSGINVHLIVVFVPLPVLSCARSYAPILPPALPHWVLAKAALAQMRPGAPVGPRTDALVVDPTGMLHVDERVGRLRIPFDSEQAILLIMCGEWIGRQGSQRLNRKKENGGISFSIRAKKYALALLFKVVHVHGYAQRRTHEHLPMLEGCSQKSRWKMAVSRYEKHALVLLCYIIDRARAYRCENIIVSRRRKC